MTLSFKQHINEESGTVYFTFGRFNPPTIGHGKLMDKLASVSGKDTYRVFLSQSQDAKKNPLSYNDKVKAARKMFPKHGRAIVSNRNVRNAFDCAVLLYNEGFRNLVMVVGADRIREFDILLNKYNGKKANHGFYNFETIKVISAGDRDPDADGVEGMSASKQREFARKNDFVSFSQGVPKNMASKDTKRLFNDIRKGMGLKESRKFRNHIDLPKISDTREEYIRGELFQIGEEVEIISTKETGTIGHLGTNYVIIELSDGSKTRKWIDDIKSIQESPYATLEPVVMKFLDRLINGNKYKETIKLAVHIREKEPNKSIEQILLKAAKITGLDYKNLRRIYDKMKKEGILPAGLTESIDYVALTKAEIGREKANDREKHSKMLQRAKLRASLEKRNRRMNRRRSV